MAAAVMAAAIDSQRLHELTWTINPVSLVYALQRRGQEDNAIQLCHRQLATSQRRSNNWKKLNHDRKRIR